jgi:Helicase associated domain
VGGDSKKQNKEKMEPDRRQRLEALLGWSWDFLSDLWEEGFSHLKQFSERERHCRVFATYKTDDGYPLGSWGSRQRKVKDTMDVDRRQRLEALPGWSWDVFLDLWEEGFTRLKQFSGREGHCRVPTFYKTDDGYRLGQWAGVQRRDKGTMDPVRRQRLEALPGWVWKVEK